MKAWELIVSIAQVSLIMVVTGALLGIGIGAFAAAAMSVYRVFT
jgi:hypothetical protein